MTSRGRFISGPTKFNDYLLSIRPETVNRCLYSLCQEQMSLFSFKSFAVSRSVNIATIAKIPVVVAWNLLIIKRAML